MQHNSETTERQLSGLIPYKKWKGNAKGRPKGARHKIAVRFLEEFLEVWTVEGKNALYKMAREYPEKFVTVAASLIPKHDLEDIEDRGLTINLVKHILPDQRSSDS
jgi:hypothetical protein